MSLNSQVIILLNKRTSRIHITLLHEVTKCRLYLGNQVHLYIYKQDIMHSLISYLLQSNEAIIV